MIVPRRELRILQKIGQYCADIQYTHREYSQDYHIFSNNPTYRNAVALCLLQIGELVRNLSADFTKAHSEIPWHAIRGMRNVVAHQYGHIDMDTLWETSLRDIENLQKFCETCLLENQSVNE